MILAIIKIYMTRKDANSTNPVLKSLKIHLGTELYTKNAEKK